MYAREPTRHLHTLSHSGRPLSVSESMKVNIYLFTQFLHNHSLRIEAGLVTGGEWSSLLLPIEWSWHKAWRDLNPRWCGGVGVPRVSCQDLEVLSMDKERSQIEFGGTVIINGKCKNLCVKMSVWG